MSLGRDRIDTEHILLGLAREPHEGASLILAGADADHRVLLELIRALPAGPTSPNAGPAPEAEPAPDEPAPDEPAPRPASLLAAVTRNLTGEAGNGRPGTVVGRRPEIERILRILTRRTRNVPLLIGEPGVGKTSVVTGLAETLAFGDGPAEFRGRTVRLLDVGALFTDPRYHGRFTETMAELVRDAREAAGLVLFLDNALSTVRTREGRAEALAFFRPVLGAPGVSVVAAATTADHRRWERDAGLDRLVQPVPVAEPAPAEVLEILRGARPRLVEHHGVEITDEALEAAARLAYGQLPGHALPGAAIDLLDEASAHVRSERALPGASLRVTEAVVTRTVGASAVLPAGPRPPVLSPPVPHDPAVWSMS
ncbi:AAA family ATPase [Kitasatospora misakiensis]|uniref:AAA family ATPase n=1 Tax=Kitasatospora misakiensis TaxID=67330 RepID=A0ABW0X1A0_9ACTN